MKATISVACYDNPQFEIEADVFHDWAAHPGIDTLGALDEERWSVTHVPSGRCLRRSVGALPKEQAIELAKMLGERVPVGIVPDVPRRDEDIPQDAIPMHVRKLIRSVIFDVRGELLS